MDTVRRHPAFGEFLRGARERRGLTLLQVSSETKIPWRHLDAFERGDLSAVPNGMYRRAEVRAYARAVGLDQNLALTELERALVATGLTPAPPEPHTTAARPAMLMALGVAGVAGAVLATWMLWTKESVEAPPAHATSASPSPAAPLSSAAPANAPAPPVRSAADDAVPSVVGTTFSPPAPEHASIAPSTDAVPQSAEAAPTRAAGEAPATDEGLVVTSDPPGARVMVDGIGWGTTPLTIRLLTPGDRVLRVIKAGYVSDERRVHIASGRATTVNLILQAAH